MSHRTHSFVLRICSWFYCARCGLILLNNDATRRAASSPCRNREDGNA
jgi:hypothetical protein